MKKATRKEKRALKKFNAACVKWRRILWLGDFELTTVFADLNKKRDEDSVYGTQAQNETEIKYGLITITGDESQIPMMDDESLDGTACHELLHTVLAPLGDLLHQIIEELPSSKQGPYYNWKSREIETVTTHLTRVVRDLYASPRGK